MSMMSRGPVVMGESCQRAKRAGVWLVAALSILAAGCEDSDRPMISSSSRVAISDPDLGVLWPVFLQHCRRAPDCDPMREFSAGVGEASGIRREVSYFARRGDGVSGGAAAIAGRSFMGLRSSGPMGGRLGRPVTSDEAPSNLRASDARSSRLWLEYAPADLQSGISCLSAGLMGVSGPGSSCLIRAQRSGRGTLRENPPFRSAMATTLSREDLFRGLFRWRLGPGEMSFPFWRLRLKTNGHWACASVFPVNMSFFAMHSTRSDMLTLISELLMRSAIPRLTFRYLTGAAIWLQGLKLSDWRLHQLKRPACLEMGVRRPAMIWHAAAYMTAHRRAIFTRQEAAPRLCECTPPLIFGGCLLRGRLQQLSCRLPILRPRGSRAPYPPR